MRFHGVAAIAIVVCCAAVLQAAAGVGDGPPAAKQNCAVSDITISQTAERILVQITTGATVAPVATTLDSPPRLALDFPGCELQTQQKRLRSNGLQVRSAIFSSIPLVTRVVLDLGTPAEHTEQVLENKVVIGLKFAMGSETSSPTKHVTDPAKLTSSSGAGNPPPPPSVAHRRALGAYEIVRKATSLAINDLEPLQVRAQAGDPEAETILGLAYHVGNLLRQDDEKGRILLETAAAKGYVAAEEALGMICQSSGDGFDAIGWYGRAVEHGSIDAATNLGLIYATGTGVAKDPEKAVVWFKLAAERGDATAQLNLAAMYHRGEGVPHDEAASLRWLTKSAEQGLPAARSELAKRRDANP